MSNNKSIQILRSDLTYDYYLSSEKLLPGQPYINNRYNQLFIGNEFNTDLKVQAPVTAYLYSERDGEGLALMDEDGIPIVATTMVVHDSSIDAASTYPKVTGYNSTSYALTKSTVDADTKNTTTGYNSMTIGKSNNTSGKRGFTLGKLNKQK